MSINIRTIHRRDYSMETLSVKLGRLRSITVTLLSLVKSKTFIAYLMLILMTGLIGALAVSNLNKVTVSGWNLNFDGRVDNVQVNEVLEYMGVFQLAKQSGARVIDDLNELNNTIGSFIYCDTKLDKKITKHTKIHLNYYRVAETSHLQKVPFEVIKKNSFTLYPGQKRVIRNGKYGQKELTYRVTFKDGKQVKKERIAVAVLEKPVPKIIEEGVNFVRISRSSRSTVGLKNKETFIFNSTAYTHTGYRTATGIMPRRGVVAVDPKVIPLGTKLFIEGYGYAVAADTGGAIKGRKIDVFYETRSEALKWGRRQVKVTIIG